MRNLKGKFIEYFNSARLEWLSERENRIIELRYGLAGEAPYTLRQIAMDFGVSHERIRQILNRAFRRIKAKGRAQILHGEVNKPCAKLQQYLDETLKPQEPGLKERVLLLIKEFLTDSPILSCAAPLVLQCYFNREPARIWLKEITGKLPKERLLTRGNIHWVA